MVIKRKKERGAALIESAITIPIILLVSVSIFDFGRAYQAWQVLTNAAREGARVSIIAGKTDDQVRDAVTQYVRGGGLPVDADHGLNVNLERSVEFGSNNASRITVTYGFKFIVLGPIMKMVDGSSNQSNALTMGAVAVMRNEN
jgi:Flp pilus assembly protein TadG